MTPCLGLEEDAFRVVNTFLLFSVDSQGHYSFGDD